MIDVYTDRFVKAAGPDYGKFKRLGGVVPTALAFGDRGRVGAAVVPQNPAGAVNDEP